MIGHDGAHAHLMKVVNGRQEVLKTANAKSKARLRQRSRSPRSRSRQVAVDKAAQKLKQNQPASIGDAPRVVVVKEIAPPKSKAKTEPTKKKSATKTEQPERTYSPLTEDTSHI